MLIRSQDKEMIVNVDTIERIRVGEKNCMMYALTE